MAGAMPRTAPEASLLRAGVRHGADAVLGGRRVAGIARVATEGGPGGIGEAVVVADEGEDRRAAGDEDATLAVHRGVSEEGARRIESPRKLIAFIGREEARAPGKVDVSVGALQRRHPV